MLKPDKLMTWEEMKKEFPAKWVFVEVIEGDAANIKVGMVRAVVEDEHLADGIKYCRSKGINYTYSRTTVEPFIGVVDGVNFSITAEEVLNGLS